jgi:predicted lipoprotein with Yx(FWY)xxD motif
MSAIKTYATLLAISGVVLIVSACGGGSDSGAGGSAPDAMNATQTVSVSNVDGLGEVLVDAEGDALYAADQETGGMVLCTEGCATIWEPLTLADGSTPTAGEGLGGSLGVVNRPDGTRQVTFMDRPLYTFVEDPEPGTVTGNGFADTFDGRPFTWHVATPTGVSDSSENSSSSDGYDF